jgi:hypothetical protein
MKKITLAIDEGVLREVRNYAAEHETTVNALVRDYLTRLARTSESARAREELARTSDESKGRLGPGWMWSREELYTERAVLGRHERAVQRGNRGRGKRRTGRLN